MPPAPSGFRECNPFGGSEHGSAGLFREHRKELAAALAGLFSVLAALGLFFCVDPQDLRAARRWADLAWRESLCAVEDVGVAYRGNCGTDVTVVMTRGEDFAECMGPRHGLGPGDARGAWAATAPGRCARRGDAAYAAPGRRLGQPYRHEPIVCHNSYLPWAVLRLPNSSAGPGASRCAYEFGAARPSITGDWPSVLRAAAHLKRARGLQGGVLCWVLEADDCVVAFRDQRALTGQERGERDFVRAHSAVCGALALLFGALAVCWHCHDGGLCLSPSGGRHVALPTAEPAHAALLSERVHRVMSAAAGRLADTTPSVSGDSTLRISGAEGSHRTVQVVLPNGSQTTVSQNIASDFIDAARS